VLEQLATGTVQTRGGIEDREQMGFQIGPEDSHRRWRGDVFWQLFCKEWWLEKLSHMLYTINNGSQSVIKASSFHEYEQWN